MNEQSKPTVLIIEDTLTYQQALKRAFIDANLQVHCCSSGEEGLDALKQIVPDLIILDLTLPGMGGKEICQKIRMNIGYRLIPIMILTMKEEDHFLIEGLESGADAYMTKESPLGSIVTRGKNLIKLSRIGKDMFALGASENKALMTTQASELNLYQKNILIVDDDITYLQALKRELATLGYSVNTCDSGVTCFEYLKTKVPDLILLDLKMPEINGIEVCLQIRKIERLAIIPIVMLTGSDSQEDLIRSFEAGVNDYVIKSHDFKLIDVRIQSILRRRYFEHESLKIEAQLVDAKIKTRIAEVEKQNEKRLTKALTEKNQELHQVQLELKQAHQIAVAASEAKSEFLASMSHEIRTPLNSILGMTDILLESIEGEEHLKYLRVISNAGDTLLCLINDILDLSKVEAGEIRLEQIPFSLRTIVESTIELMTVRADSKGLNLIGRVCPTLDFHLIGDPTRVRQILINLVGNAIKFTELGNIVLNVERDKAGDQDNESLNITFSVTDEGVGIPADKLDSIFDSFTQSDSSVTRKFGGSGLGLTISKKLVNLMQGKIWVESTLGKGSTFYLTIPLNKTSKHVEDKDITHQLKRSKCLIVDDNQIEQNIYKELLEAEQVDVTCFNKLFDALVILKDNLESIDFVLFCAPAPLETCLYQFEQIKNAPEVKLKIVVALPSFHRREDILRLKELGISNFLVRPIKRNHLIQAVTTVLKPVETSKHIPKTKTEDKKFKDDRNLKILLADDAEDNRFLMEAYFKDAPYTIDYTTDGQETLDAFFQKKYDIVLMDMQMPVLDGYKATSMIRQWEKENNKIPTPILAFTANALVDSKDNSLAAGCTDLVTKPVKKATLVEAILQHTGFYKI
ncbi:MAG: response regulator [Bacteriovoracaceae bacterium]|nr:response regulator [Bacteriovoracaceae bacterium]